MEIEEKEMVRIIIVVKSMCVSVVQKPKGMANQLQGYSYIIHKHHTCIHYMQWYFTP